MSLIFYVIDSWPTNRSCCLFSIHLATSKMRNTFRWAAALRCFVVDKFNSRICAFDLKSLSLPKSNRKYTHTKLMLLLYVVAFYPLWIHRMHRVGPLAYYPVSIFASCQFKIASTICTTYLYSSIAFIHLTNIIRLNLFSLCQLMQQSNFRLFNCRAISTDFLLTKHLYISWRIVIRKYTFKKQYFALKLPNCIW